MTTKHRPLNRSQGLGDSPPRWLSCSSAAVELQAAGHDDVDDESPEHEEYREIDKQLNCVLTAQFPAHAISVLDVVLDKAQPLAYMRHLASGGPDWYETRDCGAR
jgi:hypothetical protein